MTEPVLRRRGGAGEAGWRAEGAGTRWCTLRAASVVGVRHRLAGAGSDDYFAWSVGEEALMLAVADGIGSVEGSAAAARRVAEAAVTAGDRRAAIVQANEAAEGGGTSTLVAAAVFATGRFELMRVGDSTAFLLSPEGPPEELFPGPDPDRADAATPGLPADDPTVEEAAGQLSPGSVLVLATDGVADPWRDGPTTVAPALQAELLARPSPPRLLEVIDFSRLGCHDDRTLTCVWLSGDG
ncbi:MAG TPA: protein phosphatase 2C domain-containing protein [Acidimicrobiales bacterium]|nr:protein phosphatase 2C domain-containing protein [Acidimicrobiales bacterium]